jgi:hypothetical protein
MRKLVFAVGTATAMLAGMTVFSGGLQAAPARTSDGFRSALNAIGLAENVQYIWEGKDYCWYDDGWHGPGWYWCGYRTRRGLGWGGESGWRGWERRERREERGERHERREEKGERRERREEKGERHERREEKGEKKGEERR